jgi:hypothetical protein
VVFLALLIVQTMAVDLYADPAWSNAVCQFKYVLSADVGATERR